MKHSYTRYARLHPDDLQAIKAGTRTLEPRIEFGLIRYDTAAYGSNPDDTKAEHQEYISYGLAATWERAHAEKDLIELPADAKPLHRESRAVGVPPAAWGSASGGVTPRSGRD